MKAGQTCWLLITVEDVVGGGEFAYVWGPFDGKAAAGVWLLEFYNRLVEEYSVTPSLIIQDEPPNIHDTTVRAADDLDEGGECLLYDENVWNFASNQLNCDLIGELV